jgi:hypothetical protein
MAEVNKVYKKAVISKWDVVFYQLLSYCFFNKIQLSNADLDCVVLLATTNGGDDISSFCNKACDMNIFKTPQSVRNSLNKIVKKGVLIKDGKNKKRLNINPSIGLISEGNILLNYNFLAVETN